MTKPIRYEKNVTLHLNKKTYTLINFLSEKRIEKKITKKSISNIIKNNDYWYSQIEMGTNDDSRRKFINRPDLIDIISVIIYDAKTKLDLERLYSNSENYIDNILKVSSFDKLPREIPVYEAINKSSELFTPEYANNRINDCLNDFNSVIQNFYKQCNPLEQDAIINFLNTLVLNLSTEPVLTLHYCGLPFCSFFAAQPKDERSKKELDENALADLDSILVKYSNLLCENDMQFIMKKLAYHIVCTDRMINNIFIKAHNNTVDE